MVDVGPIYDDDSATATLQENAVEDTSVGQYQAGHSNTGETLEYSLGGADRFYFGIDTATGELETSSTPLDYEGLTDHEAEVEITARDSSGRTDTMTVTVTVTNECTSAGEPPCAPNVAAASATRLRVTWSGPTADSHDVQYRELGVGANWTEVSDTGASRSYTITGLSTGTTYEVQVRAVKGGITSDWSPSSTGRPQTTVPRPPSTPSVSAASSSSLAVSWLAPSGGPSPSSYDLQYRRDGTGNWSSPINTGSSRSYTITGLSPSTAYEVQVRARNSSGPGGWSSSGTGTTSTVTPRVITPTNTGGGSGGSGGFAPPAPPAPPRPISNFQAVGDLFRPLEANGTLGSVWRLVEGSQRWLYYDPKPELSQFSTLRTVNVGADPPTVLIVQVSRAQQFRGYRLHQGANFLPITAQPMPPTHGAGIRNVRDLLLPLITSGVLQRAWWLDNQGQEWKFFDPDPELAGFNTLSTIDLAANPPVVLAISVDRHTQFRGRVLFQGWNYVVMR